MKKIIYAAMAVVSMSYSAPAMAQSQDLQTKVNAYFTETLKAQQTVLEKADREAFSQNKPSDTKLQLAIKRKDVTDYQKMVWAAWCEANKSLKEEKLMEAEDLKLAKHSLWNIPACLEPDAVMPYYYGKKGVAADGKYPLFLYVHGSGPKDQEWENGIQLGLRFKDSPSIYFIPDS